MTPEDEGDKEALQKVQIGVVPLEFMRLLKAAVEALDRSTLEPLQTRFGGETLRTQCTYGSKDCVIEEYAFSRRKGPIVKVEGPMLALLEAHAAAIGIDKDIIIMHVNSYPQGTKAGVDAHQDDEKCIDQSQPIYAYQVGGSGKLYIWSGPPKGRSGAWAVITEEQYYVMPAGFQAECYHAFKRDLVRFTKEERVSITFRVVVS
jgi:hypothetical protein